MDVLKYTNDEIIKNLILTETHLKQATSGVDEQFCQECLDKHFFTISGLADEGLSFTEDPSSLILFNETKITADNYRGGDYKTSGIVMAQRMRNLRKKFTNSNCPECNKKFSNPSKIIKLTKSLNTNSASKKTVEGRPHTQSLSPKIQKSKKSRGEQTMKLKEVGAVAAGQAGAEAIRYGVETYKPEWLQYLGISGGVVLTGASLYLLKKKPKLQALGVIAGTNLLMAGVAAYVRGAVTPVPAARITRGARLPVLPTRRARGAILASPQARAYSDPAQAGLIRVD